MNTTKQQEKNKMAILTVASTGVRNSVKISDIHNKSNIIKILEAITSMIVPSSSLTSSILGRLYRNLIHVTYLICEYSNICKDNKKGEKRGICLGYETFCDYIRINNEPII